MGQNNQELETKKNPNVALTDIKSTAQRMIAGGLLPKGMNLESAITIALKGKELGIPVVQSLSEIYVIQGKAELKAELKLQLAAQRIMGFKWSILEMSDKQCVVKYSKAGADPFTYTFTWAMAVKMGVTSKDNWKKAPDLMLFYRNVSNALRVYAPEYKDLNFQVVLSSKEEGDQAIEDLTGTPITTEANGTKVNRETGEVIDGDFTQLSEEDMKVFEDEVAIDDADMPPEDILEDEEEEIEPEPEQAAEESSTTRKDPLVCEVCNADITKKVSNYSAVQYKKYLCFDCQKTVEKE